MDEFWVPKQSSKSGQSCLDYCGRSERELHPEVLHGKAHWSAVSSMILLVGFAGAVADARSIRINTGSAPGGHK
jgi:hypothetical protein